MVSGSGPASGGVAGKDGKGGFDGSGRGGAGGSVTGGNPAAGVPGVSDFGQDRPGTPPPSYGYATGDFGSGRSVTPPPQYSPVAGGDPVSGVSGVSGVDGPGTPSDAVLPNTVTPRSGSGAVADLNGEAVSPGDESSVDGGTGRDGDSGVDPVVGRGDAHRWGEAAVPPDSAVGSRAVPYPRQDPAAALPAAVPVGVQVDAVPVPVPANVVADGGLVEFVRGGVADSSGGPVLLVAQSNPGAGVVVSPGQGSALAQGMGRDVVALTPGQGGRGPQWTVFAADGSVPRPVPGAPEDLAGAPEGLAGLVESSAAVPGGVAGSGPPPAGQWSRSDLRGEIDRARKLDRSGGDELAARRIVEDTHDISGLVGGDAAVSLEEVVALVAAKHHELGDAHQDQVVEFSQALADRLGTRGSGLTIQAGAGPAGRSGESAAELGSGRHTSGGPSPSGAAVPVDDTTSGAGDQRVSEELAAHAGVDERVESGSSGGGGVVEERSAALSGGEFVGGFPGVSSPMAAPTEADVRERIAALQDAVPPPAGAVSVVVALSGRCGFSGPRVGQYR